MLGLDIYPPWLGILLFDATERRVDVRIVRLEPVAEGAPKHASGGARRASLHDVVFSIKKIRGVTGIERHRRKARQRCKYGARPLPAVPNKIMNPECTHTVRVSSARRRGKMRKIKIAELRCWRLVTPWIAALFVRIGDAICCAMELLFARQLSIEPLCIRGRFRMAYIDWQLHRQRPFRKHAPIIPNIPAAMPKGWVFDPVLFPPGPTLAGPERTVTTSAVLHE